MGDSDQWKFCTSVGLEQARQKQEIYMCRVLGLPCQGPTCQAPLAQAQPRPLGRAGASPHCLPSPLPPHTRLVLLGVAKFIQDKVKASLGPMPHIPRTRASTGRGESRGKNIWGSLMTAVEGEHSGPLPPGGHPLPVSPVLLSVAVSSSKAPAWVRASWTSQHCGSLRWQLFLKACLCVPGTTRAGVAVCVRAAVAVCAPGACVP